MKRNKKYWFPWALHTPDVSLLSGVPETNSQAPNLSEVMTVELGEFWFGHGHTSPSSIQGREMLRVEIKLSCGGFVWSWLLAHNLQPHRTRTVQWRTSSGWPCLAWSWQFLGFCWFRLATAGKGHWMHPRSEEQRQQLGLIGDQVWEINLRISHVIFLEENSMFNIVNYLWENIHEANVFWLQEKT